jgi:hypothetical protein
MRRRMRLRYGDSFLEKIHLFSTDEIEELHDYCIDYIELVCCGALVGKVHGASRFAFHKFGCEFYMELGRHQDGALEWVLDLENIPPGKRPRRIRSDAGKRGGAPDGAGAMPARVRRPRRTTAKRAMQYLYKKASSFGRKLTAFMRETSTMRFGLKQLLQEIRVPRRVLQYMLTLRQSIMAQFIEPLKLEFSGGGRFEPRLLCEDIGLPMTFFTLVRDESSGSLDYSLFGEVMESERLPI